MDDLISRAAAIEALSTPCDKRYRHGVWETCLDNIETAIRNIPAVSAAPVVHGRWIEVEEGDGDYTYDCSVCGGKWWLAADTPEENGMKYCPYCGAKMDEEWRDGDGKDA